MKVCTIYNQYDKAKKPVGYLVYFEQEKSFFIELCKDANPCEVPLMFASFLQKKRYTLDELWSKKWVQARIIPSDRQNLGQILRDNNLKFYDEYQMLILGKGICSHDDFCVEELPVDDIQCEMIYERMKDNIRDVMVSGEEVLVFYRNGQTMRYDVQDLTERPEQQNYMKMHMQDVGILPGGYGMTWNLVVNVYAMELQNKGRKVDVTYDDFCKFARNNIVNTAQACEILDCTRQNIDDLVKRERLEPISVSARNKLFLKAQVEEKKW